MEETKTNLFQRLLAITSEMSHVAKNLDVGFGKNAYKAVSETDVLNEVKPLEAKHGVYSYPVDREIIDQQMLVTESEYKGEVSKKTQQFLRVKVTYRFLNVDNPEEHIDIISYGDGVDSMDKAPGKAITYADKYALLKAYKIQTGEDPDKDVSGTIKSSKQTGYCEENTAEKPIDKTRQKALINSATEKGVEIDTILLAFNVKSVEELKMKDWAKAMKRLSITETKQEPA